MTMAPVASTSSPITGRLISVGLKYQSYRPASEPPGPAMSPSSETARSRRTSAITCPFLRSLIVERPRSHDQTDVAPRTHRPVLGQARHELDQQVRDDLWLLGAPASAGVWHDTQITERQQSGEGGTGPSVGDVLLADDDQGWGCYPL